MNNIIDEIKVSNNIVLLCYECCVFLRLRKHNTLFIPCLVGKEYF